MKKGNLKNVIYDYVEKKSLSDKQLDSLMQLQEGIVKKQPKRAITQIRWVAIAAVFFIAISNVFYFISLPELALDERIGNEVAKNHINLKPLEIKTSSIKTVGNFFTKLGFLPIESSLLRGSTKSLIGGRYCSIQGITAAQLRLKDNKTGQVQSLYQTIYDEKTFSGLPLLKEKQNPVTVYSKGLAVDICVEKGILFALTRESNK